jgi:hypothetical protein
MIMRLMKRCGLVIALPSQRGFERAQAHAPAQRRRPHARGGQLSGQSGAGHGS